MIFAHFSIGLLFYLKLIFRSCFCVGEISLLNNINLKYFPQLFICLLNIAYEFIFGVQKLKKICGIQFVSLFCIMPGFLVMFIKALFIVELWRNSSMFCSIILCFYFFLTFIFLIHLQFILVHEVVHESNFIFFWIVMQLFQPHLL